MPGPATSTPSDSLRGSGLTKKAKEDFAEMGVVTFEDYRAWLIRVNETAEINGTTLMEEAKNSAPKGIGITKLIKMVGWLAAKKTKSVVDGDNGDYGLEAEGVPQSSPSLEPSATVSTTDKGVDGVSGSNESISSEANPEEGGGVPTCAKPSSRAPSAPPAKKEKKKSAKEAKAEAILLFKKSAKFERLQELIMLEVDLETGIIPDWLLQEIHDTAIEADDQARDVLMTIKDFEAKADNMAKWEKAAGNKKRALRKSTEIFRASLRRYADSQDERKAELGVFTATGKDLNAKILLIDLEKIYDHHLDNPELFEEVPHLAFIPDKDAILDYILKHGPIAGVVTERVRKSVTIR